MNIWDEDVFQFHQLQIDGETRSNSPEKLHCWVKQSFSLDSVYAEDSC